MLLLKLLTVELPTSMLLVVITTFDPTVTVVELAVTADVVLPTLMFDDETTTLVVELATVSSVEVVTEFTVELPIKLAVVFEMLLAPTEIASDTVLVPTTVSAEFGEPVLTPSRLAFASTNTVDESKFTLPSTASVETVPLLPPRIVLAAKTRIPTLPVLLKTSPPITRVEFDVLLPPRRVLAESLVAANTPLTKTLPDVSDPLAV